MSNIFKNGKQLLELCEEKKIPISQAAILREIDLTDKAEEEIYAKLARDWKVMKESIYEGINNNQLKGWILNAESSKLNKLRKQGKNICGNVISKAVAYSMSVLQVNCAMGLIVACPTAGSSGVLPGAMLALQEEYNFDDEKIIDAIANAGAVGAIIARNANVSGAEGGCQAEVGSASGMTASAIVELFGGKPKASLDAACFAIENLLGLVCDPIGGLVEVPCQSRNAMGATGAIIAAEISLAGIESFIPFDEVVQTMQEVGDRLPPELRETAKGGLATTPTGNAFYEKFSQEIENYNKKNKK